MSDELKRWRGKVALVTGASSGIGRAIATALAENGLRVAIVARREERLRAVAAAVRLRGGEALPVAADLTDAAEARDLVPRVVSAWGRVDVLVNNAGMDGGRGLANVPADRVQACFDLNVRAAMLCMQAALRSMTDKRDAAIINISSLAGHRIPPPRPGGASVAYAASKHALRVMTEGLRLELAAQRSPIKVALISPGIVDTAWHQEHRAEDRSKAYGFTPLRPEDVARAVVFVLSMPRRAQVSDVWLRPVGQVS